MKLTNLINKDANLLLNEWINLDNAKVYHRDDDRKLYLIEKTITTKGKDGKDKEEKRFNIFAPYNKKFLLLDEWATEIIDVSKYYGEKFHVKIGNKWNIFEETKDGRKFVFDQNKIVPIFSYYEQDTDRRYSRKCIVVDECGDIANVKTYKKLRYINDLEEYDLDILSIKEYGLAEEGVVLYLLETRYYNKTEKDGDPDCLAIINKRGEIFCADKELVHQYFEDVYVPKSSYESNTQNNCYLLNTKEGEYILDTEHDLFFREYKIAKKTEKMKTPWDGTKTVEANILFTEKGFAWACDANFESSEDEHKNDTLLYLDNAELFMDGQYMFYAYSDTKVIINTANGDFTDDEQNYVDQGDVMKRKKSDGTFRYDYLCNERYLIIDDTYLTQETRKDGTKYNVRKGEIKIYDLQDMSFVCVSDYPKSYVFDLMRHVEDKSPEDICVAVREKDENGKERDVYKVIDPDETYPWDAKYSVGSNYEYFTNYYLKNGYIDDEYDEEWAKDDLVESGTLIEYVEDLLNEADYDDFSELMDDTNDRIDKNDSYAYSKMIDDEDDFYDMLKRSDRYDDIKEEIERIRNGGNDE